MELVIEVSIKSVTVVPSNTMSRSSPFAVKNSYPGPGAYNLKKSAEIGCKSEYKPVVVKCFFKGADSCSLCEELQYGDYYKDARRKRSFSFCRTCYNFLSPSFPLSYLNTVRKYRHCSFVHKHIDVENITYHKIPKSRVRAMSLKEKALWNKYGENA